MEKGQICEIYIHDMSHEGKGVGRVDEMAVFVDGAVIGDTVKAELTKVKKNYAFAKTMEILSKSDLRIEAACPYSDFCGGCTYGYLDYTAQTELKTKQVRDKLERIGGIENPVVNDMISMEEPFRYRNKAEFPVRGETVGFFAEKSHTVLDVKDCMLQSIPAMVVADVVRKHSNKHIKHLITRTAEGTGQVMVILVTDTEEIYNLEEIITEMDTAVYETDEYYSLESVYLNIREKKDRGHMGEKFICVAGASSIIEDTGKLKFEISPASFYQVNPKQMEKLYGKALEYMNLTGEETVLDLYCGVGTIGLYAAGSAKKVIGIESVKDAVIDANRNAVINHIVNARYITGKAEEVMPKLLEGGYEKKDIVCTHADVAVIDPPRAGCDENLLDALVKAEPNRIVYVSCDPATLARDIKFLTDSGYEFKEATPVDMFPWTSHVETVVLLSRKNVKGHVKVELQTDEVDAKAGYATYSEIKSYIKDKYGYSVSNLYIAQIKDKLGFEKRDNYNVGAEGHRVPNCPPEKEEAIMDAFRFFGMIE